MQHRFTQYPTLKVVGIYERPSAFLNGENIPCSSSGRVVILVLHLQVARKLVIIEGDLERTEERAELSER